MTSIPPVTILHNWRPWYSFVCGVAFGLGAGAAAMLAVYAL